MQRYLTLICLVFAVLFCAQAQNLKIYVSDAGNFNQPPWQILKFDASGQNGEVFISTNLAWPQDILFLEDEGVVLISNLNSGVIAKFDAETGAYIEDFATGIAGPTRMKIGPDSLLYVLQWAPSTHVLRYELDGTPVGNFTQSTINRSIGMDWDAEGNLYVASYSDAQVRKFGPNGSSQGVFIGNNLTGPTNLHFQDNGELWVLDYTAGVVRKFSAGGLFLENVITGIGQCEGIAELPNGHFLIGAGQASSVRRYGPTGTFVSTVVPTGTLGLLQPNAVVLRETTAVTTTEPFVQEDFVRPTLGDTFTFTAPAGHDALQVLVFDLAGKQVFADTLRSERIWEAHGLADGTYVVVLMEAGTLIGRQKITVQH